MEPNHYPRVEFREYDPDAKPFRPTWEDAHRTAGPLLSAWVAQPEYGALDVVTKDEDGRRWHVTARREDGATRWRVELVGYSGWFCSGEVRGRQAPAP